MLLFFLTELNFYVESYLRSQTYREGAYPWAKLDICYTHAYCSCVEKHRWFCSLWITHSSSSSRLGHKSMKSSVASVVMVSVTTKFFRNRVANPVHNLHHTWLPGGRRLSRLWMFDRWNIVSFLAFVEKIFIIRSWGIACSSGQFGRIFYRVPPWPFLHDWGKDNGRCAPRLWGPYYVEI